MTSSPPASPRRDAPATPRSLPDLDLRHVASPPLDDASSPPSPCPKRPVSESMPAQPPRPVAPHSTGPKSPVRKRRRVATDQSAESAAAQLRNAVRAALVEAGSPNSRQNRVNAVYASFRQRAIESRQQQHQTPDSPHGPSCCHSSGASSCGSHERTTPLSRDRSTPTDTQPSECEKRGTHQQQQQQQQSTASQTTHLAANPQPAKVEQKTTPSPKKAAPGVFPGMGASAGCEHYERKCWIKAACCDRYYPCRRCHDEAETHEIDRHATKQVACVECGDKDQPVASHCRSCGVEFARYFCGICKFYEARPGKDAYHCERCGICRVGKGIGIDNYHCDKCGNCVPIESKDTHPCTERSNDSNCPICTEHLGSSVEQVVFMRCGHSIHVDCLNRHAQTSFKCPICQKCLTDMSDWYQQLDERLARDVMPPQYARRRSQVYCHDCEVESTVPFHFVYHKCGSCGGYNTRVLHQFDVPAEHQTVSGGERAQNAVTAATNS